MATSGREEQFLAAWPRLCRANGFEPVLPEREYYFHPTCKWRFDFAWPALRVAVEIEGGLWNGGRHSVPMGMIADMDKYNSAAALGWLVLRFSGKHLTADPQGMFETICEALNRENREDYSGCKGGMTQ